MTSILVYLFTSSSHKCHIKSSKVSIEKREYRKNRRFSFSFHSLLFSLFFNDYNVEKLSSCLYDSNLNDYCYFKYNYYDRCYVSMATCEKRLLVFFLFHFNFIFAGGTIFKHYRQFYTSHVITILLMHLVESLKGSC